MALVICLDRLRIMGGSLPEIKPEMQFTQAWMLGAAYYGEIFG